MLDDNMKHIIQPALLMFAHDDIRPALCLATDLGKTRHMLDETMPHNMLYQARAPRGPTCYSLLSLLMPSTCPLSMCGAHGRPEELHARPPTNT